MNKSVNMICFTLLLIIVLSVPNSFAENVVPDWVKNTAGWWAENLISNNEFINGIEFLIEESIIQVDVQSSDTKSGQIPDWVKNTAGWWASDTISETEFVTAIEFLIKQGIITVEKECEFYVEEIFTEYSEKIKRHLCENNYNFRVLHEGIISDQASEPINLNSEGFRGPEFSPVKSASTYRIVMLGGSTMFGYGASSDNTTITGFVQKFLDDYDFGFNVEVINAGIGNQNSGKELELLSNKIIGYDPDLLIMYDGFNDLVSMMRTQDIVSNWEKACLLGNQEGFDVIISLQPLNGFANKPLTEYEYVKSLIGYDNTGAQWNTRMPVYDLYASDGLTQLSVCTNAVDLRNSFDHISSPIYYDRGHVYDGGNLILAEKFVDLILPLVQNSKVSPVVSNLEQTQTNESSQVTMDAYFVKEIDYEQEFGEYSLVGRDLSKTDISEIDFREKLLLSTNLSNQDLRDKDLTGTVLKGTNLTGANLSHQDLSEKKLQGVILKNANLSYANLSDTVIGQIPTYKEVISDDKNKNASILSKAMKEDPTIRADLSGANLKGANLKNALLDQINLSNADFTDVDLSGISFVGTNLSGVDLSNKDLTLTTFFGANLSSANLSNAFISDTNFRHSNLINADFSGAKFSVKEIIFELNQEVATNLSDEQILNSPVPFDTNHVVDPLARVDRTSSVKLIVVFVPDFRNADLTGVNFSNANLEDVRLDGAILDCLNHPVCN